MGGMADSFSEMAGTIGDAAEDPKTQAIARG